MLLCMTELLGQESSWLTSLPVWSLTIDGSYSCLGAIGNNPNRIRVIIVNAWRLEPCMLVFWCSQNTCLTRASIQMDGHFLHNPILGLCMHLYLACNGPGIALVPGSIGHRWMSWDVSIHGCIAFYWHPHVFLGHLLYDWGIPISLSKGQLYSC